MNLNIVRAIKFDICRFYIKSPLCGLSIFKAKNFRILITRQKPSTILNYKRLCLFKKISTIIVFIIFDTNNDIVNFILDS